MMTKVRYSLATWLKCKLVIAPVETRSPLQYVVVLYVCTQPPSISQVL